MKKFLLIVFVVYYLVGLAFFYSMHVNHQQKQKVIPNDGLPFPPITVPAPSKYEYAFSDPTSPRFYILALVWPHYVYQVSFLNK